MELFNIKANTLREAKSAGLILALDVKNRERALQVAKETADYVDAFKIGYPLVLSAGLGIASELRDMEKPVIADFKVADIPYISQEICSIATRAGADYVIIHGFLGEDVIKACSQTANIIVVCDMSHPGALEYLSESSASLAEISKKYASGIVAPATRPKAIKEMRAIVEDLTIISPGVKAQGAAVGDAITAGADFEIIGRGIYEHDTPRSEAKKVYDILRRS